MILGGAPPRHSESLVKCFERPTPGLERKPEPQPASELRPAALAAAQRARAAAAILALPAALIFFLRLVALPAPLRSLAQRSFCAAAILARPAALIPLRRPGGRPGGRPRRRPGGRPSRRPGGRPGPRPAPPRTEASSDSSSAICSRKATACFNWLSEIPDKFVSMTLRIGGQPRRVKPGNPALLLLRLLRRFPRCFQQRLVLRLGQAVEARPRDLF